MHQHPSPCSLLHTVSPLSSWSIPSFHSHPLHIQGFVGSPTTLYSNLSPLIHHHFLFLSHLPHWLPPSLCCLVQLLSPNLTIHGMYSIHPTSATSATFKSQSLPLTSSVSINIPCLFTYLVLSYKTKSSNCCAIYVLSRIYPQFFGHLAIPWSCPVSASDHHLATRIVQSISLPPWDNSLSAHCACSHLWLTMTALSH